MNQKDIERIRRLRPIDDDFFKVYVRPKEVVKEIVDAILMKDNVIQYYETEAVMKNLSGRTVEFDLYVVTDDDVHINIEVEKSKGRATPKRARLHSSSLTSSITYPGQPYEELQDTYVVFITEENGLREDIFIHHVERRLSDNSLFNDGDHIMYVNCQRYDDSQLGMIAHDMLCSNPDDMYNPVLRERARYYKETKEGVREMCEIWDEVREEGIKEGKIEERLILIKNTMQSLECSLRKAMEILMLSSDDYDMYSNMLK